MTDRWLNYVLAVVVVLGLVGVAALERPRLAEERAELLDQEVVERDAEPPAVPGDREPIELRSRAGAPATTGDVVGDHGVSAAHPAAVEIGMDVLDGGGNAVDAAVAVAYALGVAEPFGSGPGGGGSLLLHRPGDEPVAYDYREIAPRSGDHPAADIGVPGFVAGMEYVHDEHGSVELADLIEPAARLAEDGVEVDEYLSQRLEGAAHRLPIHLVPELFPDGNVIEPGETLYQPAYAEALRMIQDRGAEVVYDGELGEQIVETVSGLDMDDLRSYEVLELDPTVGRVGDYDVISGAPPVSGPTLVQILQVAEALGIADTELDDPDAYHAVAQAWRVAMADRTQLVADPDVEDVPLDELVGPERTETLAEAIPPDGFADVEEVDARLAPETDTTHAVIVDGEGAMVSMTNTLSDFFGSGQPVSGFFLNDQLKNFSAEEDSINTIAAGKRPRSFITPTIVAQDDRPVLGIGSAGGRRIPMMIAQVLVRWAVQDQDLADATAAPRFHLEGRDLEVEEPLPGAVADELAGRGYRLVTEAPTTEYFGGIQALLVVSDSGALEGVADDRRVGTWDATNR